MHRRQFLGWSALTGTLAVTGLPLASRAKPPAAPGPGHATDWDWLIGNWDVHHRRLRERLKGNNDWQEFGGKSAFWSTLGGLGNVDDNLVELPGDPYRGLSLRAYDPATDSWAIWWLDGRNPTRIDPPVRGRFSGDSGTFIGHDTLRGQAIVMRFIWRDIHSPRPWWEQAFSGDDGAHWEVNWRNWFTRTAAQPSPLPLADDAPDDWRFLRGRWRVRHRRLREGATGSDEASWQAFGGELSDWPVLAGHGEISNERLDLPQGVAYTMGMHTYDAAQHQWLAWQLDGRDPANIATPVRGGFKDGAASFLGETQRNGKTLATRIAWTRGGPDSVRREYSISDDGGAHWKTEWTSDLERIG